MKDQAKENAVKAQMQALKALKRGDLKHYTDLMNRSEALTHLALTGEPK